jgi:hypothetical protein
VENRVGSSKISKLGQTRLKSIKLGELGQLGPSLPSLRKLTKTIQTLTVLSPRLSIPLVSQKFSFFLFPFPKSTLAEADLTFSYSQISAEANAFHSLSFSQNPHFFLYFVYL